MRIIKHCAKVHKLATYLSHTINNEVCPNIRYNLQILSPSRVSPPQKKNPSNFFLGLNIYELFGKGGQNSHSFKRIVLFQCVWRCFAADPSSHSEATWKIHIHDASNEENMLARMARRASLTLRKRRSSRMDSLGNHYRESMSSVFVEDKLGMTVASILHVKSIGTGLNILMVVASTTSSKSLSGWAAEL